MQKRRASATQMQLGYTLTLTNKGGVQINVLAKVAQIGRALVVVLGDDLLARAVVAQRLAKRNVYIQRQRQRQGVSTTAPLGERQRLVVCSERLYKTVMNTPPSLQGQCGILFW